MKILSSIILIIITICVIGVLLFFSLLAMASSNAGSGEKSQLVVLGFIIPVLLILVCIFVIRKIFS